MKKIFVLAGLFASLSLSGEQEWKNVDFGGFDVREGSALDLSANIPTDAPVGVNGDLIVSRRRHVCVLVVSVQAREISRRS